MKSRTIVCGFASALVLVTLLCSCAFGQQKIAETGKAPIYFTSQVRSKGQNTLTIKAAVPPGAVCAKPPSDSDLQTFGHFDQMSAQEAASLNLQFGGVGVGGTFTGQSQAIVYRQGKTFTCPSTDGKYNIVYGSEWDSAVAVSQDSLSGKGSFATIAANVQINGSTASYDYIAKGYTNTSAWEAANAKVLLDVGSGLTVTSYGTFATDFATVSTSSSGLNPISPPQPIGYAPVGTADLLQSLAKGYALMFIAKGEGCQSAESAFPVKEAWVDSTMRSVYLQMSFGKSDCDAKADASEQAVAAQLLTGIDIEKP